MASRSPAGVALRHGGRRILLKWHMLRRAPGDPPHDRSNLRTGLERGAAVEVDLQFTADGVGVCLHDATLEAETTGRGPVRERTWREVAALRQRDDRGQARAEPPLSLAEVVEEARRREGLLPGAIQLDLKAEELDARSIAFFRDVVGPVAGRFTVAGEDAALVERLAAAAPGVRRGYEPLRLFRDDPPREPAAFRALASRMLDAAPGAEIVYLHTGLALAGLACGEDLVARLVEAGRRVDCWTIDPHRTGVADTLRRLAGSGCDQVTTNGPEALEALWTTC
jgi:glycerophosphoryl diester phosphodiesterase